MITPIGGGPAFPVNGPNGDHPGMTIRDWFAGMALDGVVERCHNDTLNQGQRHEEMFAEKAYRIADAMLAARERKEEA